MKVVLVLVLLSLILTGCNFSGKKMLGGLINKATGGRLSVSENGDKVKMQTPEGEMQLGEQKLATDFPEDLPIYPGAGIDSFWRVTENEGKKVDLSTDDSLNKVERFYRDELAKNGWQETGFISQAGTVVFSVSKDTRSAWISLNQVDNQTKIVIMVSQQD